MRSELLGVDAAQRALDELARRMGDLSPVWRDILADWKSSQKQVFSSEGASIGAHWAPLSPRYAEWKARHYGNQMLVRSGSLRAAAEGHGSGFFEKIAPLALNFKITEPTAQFHHETRPITRFGEIEQRRWFRILQAYADRVAAAVR
jgi:morphogenesis family protein